MRKKIENPFLVVVIIIFSVVAVLHFLRLSLGWDVIIEGWSLPTTLSGIIVAVTVFLAYWGWVILKDEKPEEEEKKKKKDKEENKKEKEGEKLEDF